MKEISNQEFIERYKPIENNRFPTFDTIIPQEQPLQPYIWDRREKFLISEYISNRCFWSVIVESTGDISEDNKILTINKWLKVLPGSKPAEGIAWIITECAYRPENLEYTIIEI